MTRDELIDRRRRLRISGYLTLADVGFDGPWVTPYQMASCSPDGPVLLGLHWLDAPSVEANRCVLTRLGYLPGMPFNAVVADALARAGLRREQVYVTQAFHLVPPARSHPVSGTDIAVSFDAVTRYELAGRRVVTLGDAARRQCARHGLTHWAVPHPSARGMTRAAKAELLAHALLAAAAPEPALAAG